MPPLVFRKLSLYEIHMTGVTTPTEAKRAVLDLLKRRGPSDAKDIAAVLGVTAMAVRQHLYALEDEGLVAFADAPPDGNRGRPAKLWRAEAAQTCCLPTRMDLPVG
jgi:predicted ArsR family transcriptional regulator